MPDDFDDTPLHWAVRLGQEAAAKVLMEAGAELNAQNNGDKTPLHFASRRGHITLVQELLAAGASTSLVDVEGETPLHMASENWHEEIVLGPLAAGAKPAIGPARMGTRRWTSQEELSARCLFQAHDAFSRVFFGRFRAFEANIWSALARHHGAAAQENGGHVCAARPVGACAGWSTRGVGSGMTLNAAVGAGSLSWLREIVGACARCDVQN